MVTQGNISIDLAQVRMHRERPDSWPISRHTRVRGHDRCHAERRRRPAPERCRTPRPARTSRRGSGRPHARPRPARPVPARGGRGAGERQGELLRDAHPRLSACVGPWGTRRERLRAARCGVQALASRRAQILPPSFGSGAPSLVATARSCGCRVRRPHRSLQPEFLAGLGPRSWRTSPASATPDRWLPVARRVLTRAGL